jgi:beta-phosphoglucomutase
MMTEAKSQWGVIFDVDGVLVDSYEAHFESWKIMLRRHGEDMTEEQFRATFGQTNPTIFRAQYPAFDEADYDALGEEKETAYREIIREAFPEIPGAAELIGNLHEAGATLAIGSSGPPENVQAVLDVLPGSEHIAAAVNGKDVTHGKPAPEVFLKAASKINLPPERCVVVEDAPVGVEAGKAAGCKVIALTGTADALELSQADLVVDSLVGLGAAEVRALLSAE